MTCEVSTARERRGIISVTIAILVTVIVIVVAASSLVILYDAYLSQGREVSDLQGTIASLQQHVAALEQQLNALQQRLNLTGSSQSVSITHVWCETKVCGIELTGLRQNVSVTAVQIGNATYTIAAPLCRCAQACPMYLLMMPIHLQQGVGFNLSESVDLVAGQSVMVSVLADDGSVASVLALVGNGTCIP